MSYAGGVWVRRLAAIWIGSAVLLVSTLGLQQMAAAVLQDEVPAVGSPTAEEPQDIRQLFEQGSTPGSYVKGRLIVKYRDSVTQTVNALLATGTSFRGATTDASPSLDRLHAKYGVTSARPMFQSVVRAAALSGATSLSALKSAEHNVTRAVQTTFASRAARAPLDARLPELRHVYLLNVSETMDIPAAAAEFAQDPHVEYAHPDYFATTQLIPNDPFYSSAGSWGQPDDDLWGLKKIRAGEAWDRSQGLGIIVAVVDTGLDHTHPDIAGNAWTNRREVPNNGLDDDANGFIDDVRGFDFANSTDANQDGDYNDPGDVSDPDPMDGNGHGTHVAGTIAAIGQNGLGIIGVAPQARIMPVKGLRDDGGGASSDLANAIVYAAMNGADVINNSWGCGSPCPSNPTAERAVAFAHGLGAVVVFAAGNSRQNVQGFSPQNMTDPKPIVVAASTPQDVPAFFSNWGLLVDVAAPGGDTLDASPASEPYRNILSLRAQGTGQAGLVVGERYLRLAGTSMAAPHVAGLAALLLASRPLLTNDQVRQVIRASADDVHLPSFDQDTGVGRVNAAAALSVEAVADARISQPTPGSAVIQAQGPVSVRGTAAGAGFHSYQLFYGHGQRPSVWVPLGSPAMIPVTDGVLGTWPVSTLPDGVYLLRITVTTLSGSHFEDVVSVALQGSGSKPAQRLTSIGINSRPMISGDRIVWADAGDIYLFDLATRTARRITSDPAWQQSPAISGDRIVWVAGGSLYLYDVRTNSERRITTDAAASPGHPAIAGDRIVWEDSRHGNLDIYLYDLATNTERRITTDPGLQWFPQIAGNWVIWDDGRHLRSNSVLGNWDVYLYDLTTNTERQITADSKSQLACAIAGDEIVWMDGRWNTGDVLFGNWEIYAYDIVHRMTRRVTTDASAQWLPRISDHRVVAGDTRNGTMEVYLYDLVGEQEDRIRPWNTVFSDISSTRIVWQERGDLWLYELTPPTIQPLGSHTVLEGQRLTFTVAAADPEGAELRWKLGRLPDVDGDGYIDWGDIARMLALFLQPADTDEKRRADIDHDGAITILDISLALNSVSCLRDGVYQLFNTTTGLFQWTPGLTQAGTYAMTFTVSDGESAATETTTITVINVNRLPTLQLLDPDVNDSGAVTITDVMAILAVVGTIKGQPGYDPALDLNANGAVQLADAMIALDAVGLYWPPRNLAEGRRIQLYVTGTDPDGDPLTYTASTLPPGACFNGRNADGSPGVCAPKQFVWTSTFAQAGSFTVTFTVSDPSLSATQHLPITVVNVPLTITSLAASPNPFSPNGDGLNDTTTFNAILNHPAKNWSLVIKNSRGTTARMFQGGAMYGATLTQLWDGQIHYGPGYGLNRAWPGIYTYTLTAIDEDGSAATRSGTVTVQ